MVFDSLNVFAGQVLQDRQGKAHRQALLTQHKRLGWPGQLQGARVQGQGSGQDRGQGQQGLGSGQDRGSGPAGAGFRAQDFFLAVSGCRV